MIATEERLSDFLLDIKYNTLVQTYDESATKQTIILPILSYLGWNTKSIEDVQPEYPINGKRIDYLVTSGTIDIVIEVKKTSENLRKHEEQVLAYSFKKGADLSVLTNGLSWWFYLPLKKGNWDKRKFLSVDVKNGETIKSVAAFENVLSKKSITNKSALAYANKLFLENIRKQNVNVALPKIWQNLVNDSNGPLVKMLIDQTIDKYGVQPTIEEVRELIYETLTHKNKKNIEQNYRYFDAKPSVAHVLEVCWLYYNAEKDYKQAVNTVATKRNRVSTTIMDQCTRRLELKASDFKAYLENKEALVSFLSNRFPAFSTQIEKYLTL